MGPKAAAPSLQKSWHRVLCKDMSCDRREEVRRPRERCGCLLSSSSICSSPSLTGFRLGLSSWTGDYKPRFYSLNGKTEKEQQIFINELFKYDELPDQGLPDCQISFWFPGPGVWINRDKSFLLWTDGGKRVSITSTQKGGNMKEVLKRFYIGQLMTEELFKKPEQPLTWNDNLGEGLTCSSRLGTKFEVGVNTRFPNLRNQPSFPHILKTQNLQKKDTEGLCSHIIYGTIDRLFSLEFQEILTKFESLIQMEKKLENGEGIKDLPS
uniref:Creatine kinase M-type n=1 Tax=Leptobrachium leishanense TaxID=445787 RepID=A0A8C5WHN1_9ANUR